MAGIITGVAIEGGAVRLRARVAGRSGTPIVRADVDAIGLEVWKTAPPPPSAGLNVGANWLATPIPSKVTPLPVAVDKAVAVFNTLQPWGVDGLGFNLEIIADPSILPAIAIGDAPKGQYARAEARLTSTGGVVPPIMVAWWIGLLFAYFGKTAP